MNITEFLLARIAEDEAVAEAAAYEPDPDYPMEEDNPWGRHGEFAGRGGDMFRHVLRHNPERILTECAAKRAIIELHGPIEDKGWKSGEAHGWLWCGSCGSIDDSPEPYPCDTLKALAAVYKDHPDYLPEWSA